MIEIIKGPWHWSIAGLLIGLTVPILLIAGNKVFGFSSNLRHICAACLPTKLPFFNYDWKKESWNLFFAAGSVLGAFVAVTVLSNPNDIVISTATVSDLKTLGLNSYSGLMPAEIFSFSSLLSFKGLIFIILGGFMVGFGTRWAGGCTSGHAISGLSNLQWPSLVATITFMVAGIIMTHFGFPLIFKWLW